MEPLKKSNIVSCVAGVLALGALMACICALILSPGAKADRNIQPQGNTISVEVNKDVYDGVMAMLRHYRDLKEQPADQAEPAPVVSPDPKPADIEPAADGNVYYIVVGDKSYRLDPDNVEVVDAGVGVGTENSDTAANGDVEILSTDDGLYAIIDGKLYRLVDSDDDAAGGVSDESGSNGQQSGNDNQSAGQNGNGGGSANAESGSQPVYNWNGQYSGWSEEDIASRIHVDADGNKWYHIVWGDTLCKISSGLHFSVDELAEYNHIRNVNLIYAESDLRIPPQEAWTEAPELTEPVFVEPAAETEAVAEAESEEPVLVLGDPVAMEPPVEDVFVSSEFDTADAANFDAAA